jgi:hypothetical protein
MRAKRSFNTVMVTEEQAEKLGIAVCLPLVGIPRANHRQNLPHQVVLNSGRKCRDALR